jgi:type IV secretory pathway VirJ component
MKTLALLGLGLLIAAESAGADEPAKAFTIGRFGEVTVYMPESTPRSIALFVSGDGGWNLGVIDMARSIAAQDAIVVGIDIRRYLAALAKSNSDCASLAVDFENLNHSVQQQLQLREYLLPVLIGYSSGATVVYATLVQAPPGTFAGAMSLGFCADQGFQGVPLCPGAGLKYTPNHLGDYVFAPAPHLRDPWIALQGQRDAVCDARAVDTFAAQIPRGQVVPLPKVGHGFSVQRNWLPQFQKAYAQLSARTSSAAH